MQSCFQLTLTLGVISHTCTGPVKDTGSSAAEYYGFDPIFGRLTPSQDIKDFVSSVFRQGSEEEETTAPQNTLGMTKDSGEKLRPTDFHANMGFELYWPGGEWVLRKAELDRCNTSVDACSQVFKDYGPVCAGDNHLSAHHTFDNICELYDTNCRDGTASFMLQSSDEADARWWPVKRNGCVHLKLTTTNAMWLVLAREKNVKAKPHIIVEYGSLDGDGRYATLLSSLNPRKQIDYTNYGGNPDYDLAGGYDLFSRVVRDFNFCWNETEGSYLFISTYSGDKRGKITHGKDTDYSFPVRYIGAFGGNLSEAAWIELTGYLMAYRGECREDLQPLPTEVPKNIGGRHQVQVFNFAERLDEFGYNFTRVPGPTVNDYGGDYFFNYPAEP